MRHILKYVKHIKQCRIFYETKSYLQVHGYMDVDWASNVSYKRSTSGFMFFFLSGVVSWNNKKQPTIALSSTKVEYRGVIITTCEAV
jgi:hypothetical protein